MNNHGETKRNQWAERGFNLTCAQARLRGFLLSRQGEGHYRLRGGRFYIEIYPGKQKAVLVPGREQGLELSGEWNLHDVILAAEKLAEDW
jgi:hypothetical protein